MRGGRDRAEREEGRGEGGAKGWGSLSWSSSCQGKGCARAGARAKGERERASEGERLEEWRIECADQRRKRGGGGGCGRSEVGRRPRQEDGCRLGCWARPPRRGASVVRLTARARAGWRAPHEAGPKRPLRLPARGCAERPSAAGAGGSARGLRRGPAPPVRGRRRRHWPMRTGPGTARARGDGQANAVVVVSGESDEEGRSESSSTTACARRHPASRRRWLWWLGVEMRASERLWEAED